MCRTPETFNLIGMVKANGIYATTLLKGTGCGALLAILINMQIAILIHQPSKFKPIFEIFAMGKKLQVTKWHYQPYFFGYSG